MTTVMPSKRKFGGIRTVTLFVGEARTPFVVHEDHLCEASGFFKAAFASNTDDGAKQTLDLPDDDVQTFEQFISWLYKQTIDIINDPKAPAEDPHHGVIAQAARLFVFADAKEIAGLKTQVCYLLCRRADINKDCPMTSDVEYIFANTHASSSLRRLVVDWYAYRAYEEWLNGKTGKEWLVTMPEFTAELVGRLSKRSKGYGGTSPFGESTRDYREDIGMVGETEKNEHKKLKNY